MIHTAEIIETPTQILSSSIGELFEWDLWCKEVNGVCDLNDDILPGVKIEHHCLFELISGYVGFLLQYD